MTIDHSRSLPRFDDDNVATVCNTATLPLEERALCHR